MITARGRAVRLAASAAVVGLLLLATWRGSDDWFPFTPFRMYAGRNPVDGVVTSNTLQGVRPDGSVVRIRDGSIGMRRAELEGQLPSYVANPARLAEIDAAHRVASPQEPAYDEIRIVQRRWQLHGGRIVDTRDVVIADWRRP